MENQENIYVAPETEEATTAEENTYGQDFANYQTPHVTWKEFMENHESFNKTIKVVAIISYVLIGLNALTILFNFWVVIDIAILLGCTLGVHVFKMKGWAFALLAYGIFSVIVGILSSAGPTGWMWIVFAIIYLVQFNKVEKEYKYNA